MLPGSQLAVRMLGAPFLASSLLPGKYLAACKVCNRVAVRYPDLTNDLSGASDRRIARQLLSRISRNSLPTGIAMFSWITSKPDPPSTAKDSRRGAPKLYDPLNGGKGAGAFYQQEYDIPIQTLKKLKGSAASYYGAVPPKRDGYDGAAELNAFLQEGRRKLATPQSSSSFRVVLGNEAADIDSIASAIAYAYFLDASTPVEADLCHIPLVAIPRSQLHLRTDVAWLLPDTGLDVSSLLFSDEIDLADLFARNKLQLVLVDHNVLSASFQDLQNVVVEIVDHHVSEERYPWVIKRTIAQVGSCSTLVAEKISEAASELLANVALGRLLLAAILTDTANFDPAANRFDPRDEIMAGLLALGAGSLGSTAFADLLREKKYDQLSLTTDELLRRDYKQWTLGPGTVGTKGEVLRVGIASVGLSLAQMVGKDPSFAATARAFAASNQLHILVIMSLSLAPGSKKFKRELALISEVDSLLSGLSYWLQNDKQGLKLRPINVKGVPPYTRAFSQGAVTASRKQIQPLLATYFNYGG